MKNRIKQGAKESTARKSFPISFFWINMAAKREKTVMGCCLRGSSATAPPMGTSMPATASVGEVVIQVAACRVHLMDEGEALELAQGHFMIVKTFEENVSLATIIKVGDDLQWPLTKDEPVVKLDALHYLFSLLVKDGEPLSYGVTFSEATLGSLSSLDSFLKDHSCFSGFNFNKKNNLDWREFAPKVDNYNHFLAKAIAGGTGQIVKGIFICSNAYTNKVQKGGEKILNSSADEKNGVVVARESMKDKTLSASKKNKINKNLKRVRNVSKMTEKLSKSLLNGVGIVSGSVMNPVLKSQPGKAFLKMLPGEVLLASLDATRFLMLLKLLKNKLFLPLPKLHQERFLTGLGKVQGKLLNMYLQLLDMLQTLLGMSLRYEKL
ncbi:senescence/dehydration-associated protein At4g35985, chloroplastic isoform X3 [Vigna angularis]|uniref:senescence/dehydration-associated protein At4g35985, chloroplastic isoform X3 n=1 Tax=Phaseolus angularis TaxID=3914 RepID=UPI0022B349A0|nr:senescence/dehydration-associated protein At4g35985, chloroplastic isoform X3 [Vigna angularis]